MKLERLADLKISELVTLFQFLFITVLVLSLLLAGLSLKYDCLLTNLAAMDGFELLPIT